MGAGLIAYLCWFALLIVAVVVAIKASRPVARIAAPIGALLCFAIVSLVIGYYDIGASHFSSTTGLITIGLSLLGIACLAYAVASALRQPAA